ncbi:fumarylacetoacetate hydrolase family protein [Pedosphaera parvula]|uniref:Fumarylacetoacetate (FAA) hydrolase n=1 Tax=Pedosphaera parvula (strain Ellin514) TaxID=320771 RepID=B9XB70_PEDPL|nr:fumarylacetoacetate hydrolase family protein [Pedosphaera parvula]EEF62755.1 fumarylacetoacetate (FAA) hydrolase [Pedosphaera parvula Ellin514]
MKLCRFRTSNHEPRVGLVVEDSFVLDLSSAGILSLESLLEAEDLRTQLENLSTKPLPRFSIGDIRFCAPVERQEVWAAGVTYLRSKKARMEESNFSATAYDRVYEAERPEIFFKSLPQKVVATGDAIGIRKDARWNVPEPELALVLNSRGSLVGYTIGNDMSSRDIEGENLLYLPQAKTYSRSCALGPFITVGVGESEARSWEIRIQVQRSGEIVFSGDTSVSKIKRSFKELIDFLFRSQEFPHGAVLLTGTGVVPPDHFSLEEKDAVRITISGIGTLENPVIRV